MTIEELRDYCLSLDGVTEKTPFGKFAARYASVLVFYVCDHMFCMTDIDDFRHAVVKNTPERIAHYHETRNACESMRNMSARHWIQLNFGSDIPDSEILEMVRESHSIVKAKYSPAKSYKSTKNISHEEK